MNAPQKIAGFTLGLVVVFAASFGVGTTVGSAGGDVGFHTTIPSNGDYRLFLDFKHEAVVRTAEFTVSVGAGQESTPTVPAAEPGPGHGH